MRDLTIYFAVLGIIFLLTLRTLCLLAALPYVIPLAIVAGLLANMLWVWRSLRRWKQERRVKRAQYSKLAETLTPHLQGDYSPYVIEAAGKLGEARDMTAVPALLTALERCLEQQQPGWRERATSLADALARIGDRRALPLLYRLDNVRGIGLIPAVRNAIAAIEPQTSLLRPGDARDVYPGSLLRSVQQRPHADEAPVLLRSAEKEVS